MLKSLVIIFLATAFFLPAPAQQITQTLRGTVIDQDSRIPLAGAHIVITSTHPQKGTITDAQGHFSFGDLPVGRYDLYIGFLGYEPATLPHILLQAGKETVLEIGLTESVVKLKDVVVQSESNRSAPLNRMATVSVMKVDADEMDHYAGTINDVARVVSSYAGVASSPSGSNDIIIRGNSPRGMGWRLEGLDIPNPNHYAEEGSSSGGISILNAAVLASSDFYTGAFPARYGNAYSGIFDMQLRDGNSWKREYSLQAGFLGIDFTAEGPFRKDASSYLVNYRFSTLALFNTIGIRLQGDAVPSFQDLTFKVKVPTQNAGTFTVFGIAGISNIHEEEEHFINDYLTSMSVAGMKNVFPVNKTTYVTNIIAYTGSVNKWNYKTEDAAEQFSTKATDDLIYNTPRISSSVNKKFSARDMLSGGVILSFPTFNLESTRYDYLTDTLSTPVRQVGNTVLGETWVNWKHRFSGQLTMTAGLHSMYLSLSNAWSVEPRLGLRWDFRPTQALTAGLGSHSRMESLSTYYMRDGIGEHYLNYPNLSLRFLKALHLVAGYENLLTRNLFLKAELYYQYLYDVPVENSDTSSFSVLNTNFGTLDRKLVNRGTGRNAGLEITLEKYFSDNYYFLITTSLFDAKYRARDGVLRNTRYNTRYVFNVLGGKDFLLGNRAKRTLSLNLKGTWTGGQWHTPIDTERSAAECTTVRDERRAFSEQWNGFLRIDFKVSLTRDRKRATHTLELDIQNITNNLNVIGDYYDPYSGEVRTITQMGIVPILNYKILF